MADANEEQSLNAVELATELTIAWLGNPNVRANADEVPAFLKSMHATIGELEGNGKAALQDAPAEYTPAVPVRSSVKPDYIVSLIDGSKLKSLKRHLSKHGLTPNDYRARYGLKADYPMVAANYSAQRRAVAERLGLGRKRPAAAAETPPEAKALAASPPVKAKRAPAQPKASAKPATNGSKAAVKASPAKRGRGKKADAPKAAVAPKPRGRRKVEAPTA